MTDKNFAEHQLHIVWYAKDKYGKSENVMDDLKVFTSLISGCSVEYISEQDVLHWVHDLWLSLLPREKTDRLLVNMFHSVYDNTGNTVSISQVVNMMLSDLRYTEVRILPLMPEIADIRFD